MAVHKLDLNYNIRPFVTDMMNATGLAFDQQGLLYSSPAATMAWSTRSRQTA